MRYITPKDTIGKRFENADYPDWDVLVIIFRDRDSEIVKEALNVQAHDSQVFSGIEGRNTSSLKVNGLRVGVVDRCIWGGPQAGILVEEAAEAGIKTVIGVGACGSISEKIHKGAMTIARNSFFSDGTSKMYRNGKKAEPSGRLFETALAIGRFNPISAQAVCVDALYRETKELIDSFIGLGGEIINMESSALYAASRLCGVESIWIGCVSDCIVGDTWQDWSNTADMSYQSGLYCKEILEQLSVFRDTL